MTIAQSAPEREQPASLAMVVAGASAGTVFEWYDFFIFGSLAAIIAKHFFSGAGDANGYIFALLTFAAGFAVRPLGAVVFGHFGDKTGRKRTFLVTIVIMGTATFAVGLLPEYASIGIAAPTLLVAMRVLQGFAVGGEYGGAAVYVAEHAKPDGRGQATGWIQVSASGGLILALSVILLTRTILGEDAFMTWGWRIPFLISALLLAISLWIRLRLQESPAYRRIEAEGAIAQAPLSEALGEWRNLRLVVIVFVLAAGQGAVWYTAQFYTQFFLERVVKVEPATVNLLIIIVTALSTPLYIAFATLSDRIGRKPVMLFGLALAAISFFPGFHLLTQAVNPALAAASARVPVVVSAPPGDCAFQLDLIGKTKFLSACDIAKTALTKAGVPYRSEPAPNGAQATVHVGPLPVRSFDGKGLSKTELAREQGYFDSALTEALRIAGYPTGAAPERVDMIGAIAMLMIFMLAAAALYGPQAAALVELFPTRIRYSALSIPYHTGNGWFGGFLPATAFAIVVATGNIYAGLWYPVIVAAIAFTATLVFLPETKGRDIEA